MNRSNWGSTLQSVVRSPGSQPSKDLIWSIVLTGDGVIRLTPIDVEVEGEMLGSCSAITYSGDRNGMIIVDIDDSMGEALLKGMGLDEGGSKSEMVNEMSNLILGNLKKKIQEHAIELGTPQVLNDIDEVNQMLKGQPALQLQVSSGDGVLRMLYQMELEAKVKT